MTPTPLEQLTPEAVAKMDGPEVWRYALEVMGAVIEKLQVYGKRMPDEPDPLSLWYNGTRLLESWDDGETWTFLHFDSGDWWRLGLAVEWIEARGCDYFFAKTSNPDAEGPHLFSVTKTGKTLFDARLLGISFGESEPLAAARWVVEHGHKIAKEKEA